MDDNINPRNASRLPLLFAIDTKLAIGDGFAYVPDCDGVRRAGAANVGNVHCGGDFASSSVDGSTDGFGASESGASDAAGGDGGGGDSGGGDGGGCGGGGCSS